MKKSNSRIQAAIRIRKSALRLVQEYGEFEDTNIGPLMTYKSGDLDIAYTTPFQKIPPPSEEVLNSIYAAGLDPVSNLPYGLDIWTENGKVLNIEWGHDSRVHLISFKRGAWEERVFNLA